MKVTTLGAWLDAFKPLSTWTLIKAKLKSELGADATVLLPDECPDCVGVDAHEGECQRCHGSGEISRSVGAADFMDECPNCDGTGRGAWTPCGKRKAVVVPKEQAEAAGFALHRATLVEMSADLDEDRIRSIWETMNPSIRERRVREALASATALLGGKVYRATAVGTLIDYSDHGQPAHHYLLTEGEPPADMEWYEGRTVAILDKEAHGKGGTNA